MLTITAIPAFKDNYIWLLRHGQNAVVVDPGEALPVFDFLHQNDLELVAILCTHRHHDHIGGIAQLREVYNVPVYGRSHPNNPHITHNLRENDLLYITQLDTEFHIIEVSGHLDDHIAFISSQGVFSGDIMFGGGCGKNFEGTLAQLHHSLQRLAALADDTQIYCAHEYTSYTLLFAQICEPSNRDIRQRIIDTQRLRAANLPTVPLTIALEKATNPFIRCASPEIIRNLQARGLTDTSELGVFTALEAWHKDFRLRE